MADALRIIQRLVYELKQARKPIREGNAVETPAIEELLGQAQDLMKQFRRVRRVFGAPRNENSETDEIVTVAAIGIVPLASIKHSKRLDALYNVVAHQMSEPRAKLAALMSADEAKEILHRLMRHDLAPLLVFSRGDNRLGNASQIDRAIEDDPFLCLAVVQDKLGETRQSVADGITAMEGYAQTLAEIAARLAQTSADLSISAAP